MSHPQYPAAPAYPQPPAQQPPPGYGPGQPAAPQPYPGQPVYPGQVYPAGQPAGWGHHAAAATPQLQCRFCGSVPAVRTTFRGHQGMLIVMRFLSLPGPYCRDCGLATFREMTSKTLVQGWWGYISFVVTPFTVLWNLIVSRKVRNLPPPGPAHPDQRQRPMDPGPRLLMRPMTIVGLAIPPALLILLMLIIVTDS